MFRPPLSSFFAAVLIACGAVSSAFAEGPWLTNFEEARKVALKEGKPLLLDFTGSDWCPPCKMLHKSVFDTPEFIKEAPTKYVLVMLDFPRMKKQPADLKAQNESLQRKYAVTGYPTVLLVDPKNGEVYGRTVGYGGWDARKFFDKLDTFVNSPSGKAALAASDKVQAAVNTKDFAAACKAIDAAFAGNKVMAAVNKAMASLRMEPTNKERALKYLDEALALDDGSKAASIRSLRDQIAGGKGAAGSPEAKKPAEEKSPAAKKLEKAA